MKRFAVCLLALSMCVAFSTACMAQNSVFTVEGETGRGMGEIVESRLVERPPGNKLSRASDPIVQEPERSGINVMDDEASSSLPDELGIGSPEAEGARPEDKEPGFSEIYIRESIKDSQTEQEPIGGAVGPSGGTAPPPNQPSPPFEQEKQGQLLTGEPVPDVGGEVVPGEGEPMEMFNVNDAIQQQLLQELIDIETSRLELEVFKVYGLIPLFSAIIVVYLLLKWFGKTFVLSCV